MASPLDGPLRAVAKNVMRRFGAEGTIEYVGTGTYNPTTGTASSDVDKTLTAKGLVERYTSAEIDGTLVLRGDLKWTVAALGIDAPRPNDLVTIDEKRHTVISVSPTWSGEEVALYALQLRR